MRGSAAWTRAVFVATLAVGCAVAGGLGGFAGVGGFAGSAGAAEVAGAAGPALSPGGVELTTSLQGFMPAPAGAFNGPVSTTTLLTYTTDPDVLAEIENGSVSAYLRTWSRPFGGTDGVIADLVVEFPDHAETTAFLTGLKGALTTQSAVSTFAVKSPSGAEGYTAHGVIVANSTDVAVSLGRGDFAAFVLAATPAGNVSPSQIELVAAAAMGGVSQRCRCLDGAGLVADKAPGAAARVGPLELQRRGRRSAAGRRRCGGGRGRFGVVGGGLHRAPASASAPASWRGRCRCRCRGWG